MDMMTDLETMSTRRDARVIQGGWACFEPLAIGVEPSMSGEMNVNSDTCLGGHVSHDTFMFWLTKTSDEARRSVSRPTVSIALMLGGLFYTYRAHNCQHIWSNGATFDIVIIEHWAEVCGLVVPWNFYDHRDTRTLFSTAEHHGWEKQRGETAHTARADCVAQVAQVQSASRFLAGLKPLLAPPPEPPQDPMPARPTR